MAIPEWLLGPAGDLRPLPPMEMDVVNAIDRFGGVHTSISGGRTVDVLGYKSRYEFELNHVEPEEYARLESLFTATVPGPFKLIDPLRKNWFSREAAMSRTAGASGRGVTPSNSSTGDWVLVEDGPVDWNQRAVEWTGLTVSATNGGYLGFDKNSRFPRSVGTITASAYVNPNEDISLRWHAWNYDAAGTQLESTRQDLQPIPANTWTRITYTYPEPPAGTVTSGINLWCPPGSGATANTKVLVMSPQLELGEAATSASLGGGLITVAFDQMETTSPYYPYQSVVLSLLEV